MRSDHLKRHMRNHKDLLELSDDALKEELQSRHKLHSEKEAKRQRVVDTAQSLGVPVPEEIRDLMTTDVANVRANLTALNKIYLEKVNLGEEIAKIISEGEINEECMSKDYKHALELYRKRWKRLDVNGVVLRPWQKDLFNTFQCSPDDRTVMWIYDKSGNTGKSWFQNYIEAYYGYNRVFRCDLRIKHKDMCNILQKRSLATVDIFLFNDARSVIGEEQGLYRILEDIKDGSAATSKYDNQIIKFKTPNHVVIFSNSMPDRHQLSKDRWQIFQPIDVGLERVDQKSPKSTRTYVSIFDDSYKKGKL